MPAGTRVTPAPPAARAYQACWHRCSSATARWCTARAEPPSDEDAVSGQQRHGRVAHRLHRRAGARRVVHGAFVLVDQHQPAAAQRGALVEDRGHLAQVCPDGPEERVVVHGPAHVLTRPVQLEVERNAERHRPVPFDDTAVQIDAQHLGGSKLGPGQQPRVAQERAVAQVHGDVPGQVVVVALAPECARQHDELLAWRQVGDEFLGRRREHGATPFSSTGERRRGVGAGTARRRSHCTSPATPGPECGPTPLRSRPGCRARCCHRAGSRPPP